MTRKTYFIGWFVILAAAICESYLYGWLPPMISLTAWMAWMMIYMRANGR